MMHSSWAAETDAETRRRGDAVTRRAGKKTRAHARHQRRGMLLLVVLAIIALLALIAASFAYRMDAERMGIEGLGDIQQSRLAAESGLARVLLLLRTDRTDMDRWYSNPESFRKVPVWMPNDTKEGVGGTESQISKEPVPNQPAWRYSVVAYEPLDEDRVVLRYGLTDEAGKLNLNFASRGELLRLVKQIDLGDVPPEALVDCLIDWRDGDSELTTPAGAETPWYMMLNPSYRAKNRLFETVDELLMVRNWTGQFLYGEDHNRNGYLDENEDDGEEGAFPPDDGDGQIERGLSRLLTVYSWDWNFANDNKPRSDINSLDWKNPDKLPQEIQDELGAEVIDFLAQAKERGFKFRSVGELWGLQVFEDGSTNYDDAWDEYKQQVKDENAIPKPEEGEEGDGEMDGGEQDGEGEDGEGDGQQDGEGEGTGGGRDDQGGERGGSGRGRDQDGGGRNNADSDRDQDRGEGGQDSEDNDEDDRSVQDRKDSRRNQAVRVDGNSEQQGQGGRGSGRGSSGRSGNGNDGQGNGGRASGRDRDGGEDSRDGDRQGDRGGRDGGAGRDRGDRDRNEDNDRGDRDGRDGQGQDGRGRDGEGRDGEGGEGGEGEDDESNKGTPIVSPVTPEQMVIVMDRLTTVKTPVRVGQINVNTAPVEVLQSLIGMTAEEAKAIVEQRKSLAGPDKATPTWVVTNGALKPEKFAVLSNKLTARSIQFTADVIGFADHVGTFRRIQAVIEMRGHMAQVRYYRDISSLGIGFPVKDDERSEGFAFGNE